MASGEVEGAGIGGPDHVEGGRRANAADVFGEEVAVFEEVRAALGGRRSLLEDHDVPSACGPGNRSSRQADEQLAVLIKNADEAVSKSRKAAEEQMNAKASHLAVKLGEASNILSLMAQEQANSTDAQNDDQ